MEHAPQLIVERTDRREVDGTIDACHSGSGNVGDRDVNLHGVSPYGGSSAMVTVAVWMIGPSSAPMIATSTGST